MRYGNLRTYHEGPEGGRLQIQLYSSFNLGARWGGVVKAMLPSFLPREKALYPPCKDWEVPRTGLDA